jgi:hypothetical protein
MIIPPDEEPIVLTRTMFLVTREQVDHANTAAAMSVHLTKSLILCSDTLVEARKPEPGWRIAGRWGLIGVSVGAAFVAGLLLR